MVMSDEDVRHIVGARMRLARERAGLSQRDVAEKMKIAPSEISCWENGKHAVGVDKWLRWCQAINASAQEIMTCIARPRTALVFREDSTECEKRDSCDDA